MEDIGPTVDLLFISKYKRQLLEMVEEMKELRNAHAKKTEECQRLRSKVDALQEKLWTKDAEVADNTLKNEASADSLILAEKLQLQTKEIDELRNLKEKMKSLVEWTQSKLREAEAKNYELEVEMQKCRVTTENTPGSKDFPHELAQKYIEMHNALNQKLENLKASLEGVKVERQNVLKQQLQMRTQLELLSALLTEHNTMSTKRERERQELCNQIDMLSAKLDEATQDTLILKQLRKEDEEELERLSGRLAQAADDRVALLGRLEAVEAETRALQELMNTDDHSKLLDILKQRINVPEDGRANTAQENPDAQHSPDPASGNHLHDQASKKNSKGRPAPPSQLQLESVACQGATAIVTNQNAGGDTKTVTAMPVNSGCFPERKISVVLARTAVHELSEKSAGKSAGSDDCGVSVTSPSSIANSAQEDEGAQALNATDRARHLFAASLAVHLQQMTAKGLEAYPPANHQHSCGVKPDESCSENVLTFSQRSMRWPSPPTEAAGISTDSLMKQAAVTAGYDRRPDPSLLPSPRKLGGKLVDTVNNGGGLPEADPAAVTLAQGKTVDAPSTETFMTNAQNRIKEQHVCPLNPSDDETWRFLAPCTFARIEKTCSLPGRARRSASLAAPSPSPEKHCGAGETTEGLLAANISADDSKATPVQGCSAYADSSKSHKPDYPLTCDVLHGTNKEKESNRSQRVAASVSETCPGQTRSPCSSTQKTISFDCDTLLRAIPL